MVAVEREEVRVKLIDEQSSRPLLAREEHPSGGSGALRNQALPCGDARHARGCADPLRRRPSDCGNALGAPSATAPHLARPGHARDDEPVVAVELDRLVPDRFDGNYGLAKDLVALGAEQIRELLVAALGPRQEDPHVVSATSSAASSEGS